MDDWSGNWLPVLQYLMRHIYVLLYFLSFLIDRQRLRFQLNQILDLLRTLHHHILIAFIIILSKSRSVVIVITDGLVVFLFVYVLVVVYRWYFSLYLLVILIHIIVILDINIYRLRRVVSPTLHFLLSLQFEFQGIY